MFPKGGADLIYHAREKALQEVSRRRVRLLLQGAARFLHIVELVYIDIKGLGGGGGKFCKCCSEYNTGK